jgi:hypothetical protein
MYETGAPLKVAEEDLYEEGCVPHSATHFVCHGISFSQETVAGLIAEIAEFFGVMAMDVELDACEEPGRIDVAVMETEDGMPASDREIEEWKRKELRLWHVIYSFNVEKVHRETVSLKEAA